MVWPEDVKILPAGLGQAGNLKTGRPGSGLRVARNEAAPQELRQIGGAMPAEAWKRFTIKDTVNLRMKLAGKTLKTSFTEY